MKYIFDDIVKIDHLFLIIEQQFEDDAEKEYLKNVIRDTIHHKLLDLVLDELDEEKRMIFLTGLEDETAHPNLLERLKEWIDRFEEKICLKTQEAETELIMLIVNEA
ncbi:hypothetical protein KKG63_00500 [Patescibacteria group bacterium]|nr:hypothetical protein [Patescibacteria group bacterium]